MRASLFLCLGFLIAIMPMCVQQNAAIAQVGTISCYDRARNAPMSDLEALRLCTGSVTDGPVQCFDKATTSTTLSRADALQLCRCSTNTAPVDCFNSARTTTTLAPYDALQLCLSEGKTTADARACFYGIPIG